MPIRRAALLSSVVTALLLPVAAVQAQSADPEAGNTTPADSTEEGLGLIERGMGMLLGQIMREAVPQFDMMGRDLSGVLERLAPALQDLAVLVDDIQNYHPPERLANGDVLIRRRAEAPPPPPIGDGLRRLIEPEGNAPERALPERRQPDRPTAGPGDIEI